MNAVISTREFFKAPLLVKVLSLVFVVSVFFFLGAYWSDGYQNLVFLSTKQNHLPSRSPSIALSPNHNKSFDISTFIGNNKTHQASDQTQTEPTVRRYSPCPEHMKEYIPCLDNAEAIANLKSIDRGEKYERHCPNRSHGLTCLVPPPRGYKTRIPWPRSRDEVWFSNVPHTRLVDDKGGQNWIYVENDKFKFPGGGTQFIHGAEQYIEQITRMVPEIKLGQNIRVVLDVGCGVASFGAYLFSHGVITMSIAPKDVHENQIQFALERGVPAMVSAFATRRLLYPSQSFDLIHCSRCRINWTRDDGILLIEADRILRPGGYFAWAAQPVYKHEAILEEQWREMLNLTSSLCWELVKKEGYIAMWRKPLNNSCYLSRSVPLPPLCDDDDPDTVWYVDLKPCITRIPGSNLIIPWPARLYNPPERLHTIKPDPPVSPSHLFHAESNYWDRVVQRYTRSLHWNRHSFRNILDMHAGFGGFAAALIKHEIDCWVMNVVPVSAPNTLAVIYDRGLIGVTHDWCEPFDTYPRTYDLLQAADLLSGEERRCHTSDIMLEMDRMLRPGGHVYIWESVFTLVDQIMDTAEALRWAVRVEESPDGSKLFIVCTKPNIYPFI